MILTGPAAAGLLAELHSQCFPPDGRWSQAAMESLLTLPGCFACLIADPEPVGLALARVAADEAELLTLGVLPAMRRQGIGARLLGGFVDAADARGAGRLFLEVSAGNEAARALYHRHGWIEVGQRRSYYPDGSDALILALPLSGA